MPMHADTDPGVIEPIALEQLVAAAEFGSDDDMKALLASRHPADVAELINVLDRFDLKTKVFRALAPDVGPQVLSLVSPVARNAIVEDLSVDRLRQILEELDSDDAADLWARSPRNARRPSWRVCLGRCPHGSNNSCAIPRTRRVA